MKLSVPPHCNVEWTAKTVSGAPVEIDVAKFVIDTALLATAEKIGSAVPVILAAADINTDDVFCLCLPIPSM